MTETAMKTPVPVRFRPGEDKFLTEAKSATGLPKLELIRRGVRLLQRQQQIVHSYAFILDLGE
ncbi:MAG: hypothetical protein ABI925_11345 [Verrucomicrobiota bacterium]